MSLSITVMLAVAMTQPRIDEGGRPAGMACSMALWQMHSQ